MTDFWVHAAGLTKRFGDAVAVDGIDLAVRKGEVLGFLGPNGAGKTTTMRMLTGYLQPSAGSVAIQGHDIEDAPLAAKSCIGYLPEGAPLYADLTPRQLLKFVGQARGMAKAALKERMEIVIGQLGLEEVLDQSIDTLSKGFKRRVGLAQAILHDPPILILDEPTDGLDPLQKQEVRRLIQTMAKDKAIIISTHILEEVEAVCTRTVIIAGGRLVSDATPAALLERSRLHGSLTLQLRGAAAEAVREQLLKLSSVREAELLRSDEKRCEYRLYPAARQVDITEVSQMAHVQNWIIEGMESGRGSMDEVFIALAASASGRN
jgi:ABC-2 type transport system ATP-binding protein